MKKKTKITAYQREWTLLQKQEAVLATRRGTEGPGLTAKFLEGKVPAKLERTLTVAFSKAFGLVFSRGKGFIEKTCAKERLLQDYTSCMEDLTREESRATIRRVSRGGRHSATKHVLFAGAEGGALGLLGIGLADIPLFSALLLRSLYEIAFSYGFQTDSLPERLFLLKVLEVSLLRGEDFLREDAALSVWIEEGTCDAFDETQQMEKAAAALSAHLLYLKFLQGIPLVGIVGGLSDGVCLRRVTAYARLKFKKRFLKQGLMGEVLVKLD